MTLHDALIQFALPSALMLLAMLAARALHYAAERAKHAATAQAAGSLQARALSALEVLANCAADAVVRVESTMRPAIKAASADGKLSPEEGAALKAEAIRLAGEQAKAVAPEILKAAGMDALDSVLEHLVESAAARLAGDSRILLKDSTSNPS